MACECVKVYDTEHMIHEIKKLESERKLVDPDHVVYHGYQPSGWACDGLYIPNTLIQKIEMGNQLGIHLKKPSSPTFNHFLKCAELVDIYG